MAKRIRNVCIVILLLLLSAAVLTAGGKKEAMEEGAPSIAFVAHYDAPIIDWDPSICFSSEPQVFFNTYETLILFDANANEFIPVLATDYFPSEDGLVWTFNLRRGVKFHDGTDFTAEAVKFSYERTKNGQKGAAYIWEPLEEVRVVDDYTVELVFSQQAPVELIVSCAYAAFIMSPTAVGDDFEKGTAWFSEGNEAGTGPYTIQSQVQGDEVILTKFEDYWKGWEGEHFDKIVFKNIPENASRRQLLEKGDADLTIALTAQDLMELKNNPDVQVEIHTGYGNMIGFFNTKKAPTDNVYVRKALAYAYPYEQVVTHIRKGMAGVPTDVIPRNLWGANQEMPFHFNLEKAKELLAQAGYPDGDITITYTYNSSDEERRMIAELYKSECAKIGVNLDIRGMTWDAMWEMAKSQNMDNRQHVITMKTGADLISPVAWYMPAVHTEEEPVFNLAYYSNPEIDAMIEEAHTITSTDRERATELFLKAGQMLREDCPILYMGDEKLIAVLSKGFRGFVSNPAYTNIVFFYDCYREE